MSFSLSEVYGDEGGWCLADVEHEGQLLTVRLMCSSADVSELDSVFTAEIDYTSVVRFETDLPLDESCSGLFATDDDSVILADGVVHHVDIGSDYVLIDVYIQRGPEFLCVDSKELGGVVPAVDSRLRVWLKDLSIYPTRI